MAGCPTIVLAAPDRRTRAAMRAALDTGVVRVAGEACTRWDAGELVRAVEADAVVADAGLLSIRDFFLSGWGAVPCTTRIVAVGPGDDDLEHRLRVQGCAGYVARDRLAADLPAAVAGVRPPVIG
jgi:hypothetical protein